LAAGDASLHDPLDHFMRRIGQEFAVDVRTERALKIPQESPPVIILDGV
jgi:hypothetical protein